jgi:hypothetical protein
VDKIDLYLFGKVKASGLSTRFHISPTTANQRRPCKMIAYPLRWNKEASGKLFRVLPEKGCEPEQDKCWFINRKE